MNIFEVGGYIALVFSAGLTVFSQLPKQTIKNQKDVIESYEKRLQTLEDQKDEDRKQHIESIKAIAELQGQINVYKELPLQEMAAAMHEISVSNKEILNTLKRSVIVNATEGDTASETAIHISSQAKR